MPEYADLFQHEVAMTHARTIGFALLLVAILQPASGAMALTFGIGTPIGSATRDLGAPEQPLPVFFAIWSPIFLGCLAFALLVLRENEPWMRRVAAPLAVAAACNIVWMLSAQLIVVQPLDYLLLFPILIAACIAAWRFDRTRGLGGGVTKLIADATSGMLSGWLTVAVAISTPLTIRSFTGLGPTDYPWPMLLTTLSIAATAAWIFARYISRSLWFFVSLGWGVLGIVLNNIYATEMGWPALAAAAMGGLIVGLRLSRGADGSTRKPA
jgi:hypothetical protein